MPAARRIYLDHAASSPVKPSVVEAMLPWIQRETGNPSSLHAEGRAAKAAIDAARERVAHFLDREFAEVVFTSGATESSVLAIVGAARANKNPSRNRILLGAGEHLCVLGTTPILKSLGYRVETVKIDRNASLDLADLQTLLGEDVLLVACMSVNNEVGTVQPVEQISHLVASVGALFFCDCAQWLHPVAADLVAISGHKFGGPKGVGALAIKGGVRIEPIQAGGNQEREIRGGTENVAAIVGLGVACMDFIEPTNASKEAFLKEAGSFPPSVEGALTHPGILHVRAPGVEAETFLIRLDRMGIAAGSGAACSSGAIEPSHVLRAMGWDSTAAKQGLRFSFGWSTSAMDAGEAAERATRAFDEVRKLSPVVVSNQN